MNDANNTQADPARMSLPQRSRHAYMTLERRNALKSALMMAILTATPASIFAASKRMRDSSDRYLWLELPGRRFLSLDTANQDRAYLLVTSKLPDGKYSRLGGGTLIVRAGRVVAQRDLGR